ncbi:MAG: hypothetical protein R2849_15630 [Thermomicrobiales bacterium]
MARYSLTYLDEPRTGGSRLGHGLFHGHPIEGYPAGRNLDELLLWRGPGLVVPVKGAHGWKVVYYPEALVHHLNADAWRNSNWMIVEFYRAM